jgi:hypothetical protein
VPPYRPTPQLVQLPAPPVLYVPTAQMEAVADAEPAGQEYPAGQLPLQVADVMAGVDPNCPAGQSVHTVAPAKEYRPTAHWDAVDEIDPGEHAYPAVQMPEQALVVSPAVAPYRPPGQGPEHAAAVKPVVTPYSPAAHSKHVPTPATAYCPATHEEHAEDPSVLNWPAGHCPEHAEDVRPTVAPNVPGGHAVHTAAPAVEYRPATHCTAVGDVLPAAHAYPAVHWPEQAPDGRPVAAPKVPAGQSVQAPAPAREYCPTGQMEAVADVDPAGQAYPAVHAPLHVDDVRPGVAP